MKNLRDLTLLLVMALVAITASAQEASQQLIKNGNYELNPRVERGTSATTGWDARKPVVVTHVDPISADNPHYAVICCDTIYNEGANGMDIQDGTKYDLSIALRNIPAVKAESRTKGNKLVIVQLLNQAGKPIAEATIRVKGQGWQQFCMPITASSSCSKARLAIVGIGCQKVAIDNVSLLKH